MSMNCCGSWHRLILLGSQEFLSLPEASRRSVFSCTTGPREITGVIFISSLRALNCLLSLGNRCRCSELRVWADAEVGRRLLPVDLEELEQLRTFSLIMRGRLIAALDGSQGLGQRALQRGRVCCGAYSFSSESCSAVPFVQHKPQWPSLRSCSSELLFCLSMCGTSLYEGRSGSEKSS